MVFVFAYISKWPWDFPIGSYGKEMPAVQETRFNPWVRKIPWRREWLPSLVILPQEFHEQKSLVAVQSMRSQRVGHD